MKRSNVTLRKRLLPSGRTTLYLDIIFHGRRKFESLNLFLEPELSRSDKQKNRDTLKLAEAIKSKKIIEMQNNEFGFRQANANCNFYDFFLYCAKKNKGTSTQACWLFCLAHLEVYDQQIKTMRLSDITHQWVQGFQNYLHTAPARRLVKNNLNKSAQQSLSQNSQSTYFAKLKACFNEAFKEGLIHTNPTLNADPIQTLETTRMYLTVGEIRKLSLTPCRNDMVKRAFLFSCLTGLRYSDIIRLTWGEVLNQGDFTRIIFKQKKTKGQEYLDISPSAVGLMGDRGNADSHIFTLPKYASTVNQDIQRWVNRASIDKKISFHCGRHSFAVMMLDLGTDIYTVSKLLGHRELSTTQIYAKVLDKNKQAAVSKIPKDILNL